MRAGKIGTHHSAKRVIQQNVFGRLGEISKMPWDKVRNTYSVNGTSQCNSIIEQIRGRSTSEKSRILPCLLTAGKADTSVNAISVSFRSTISKLTEHRSP